jgi:hypothetical protein
MFPVGEASPPLGDVEDAISGEELGMVLLVLSAALIKPPL